MSENIYSNLYDLYVIKELSTKDIGEILKVTSKTVLRRLKKAGINIRCKFFKKREIKEYWELTPIEYKYSSKGISYWSFQCSCGQICVKQFSSVEKGNTKSCGHLKKRKGNNNPNTKGYNNISLEYFKSIKNGAIKRGFEFNITIEDMDNQFEAQNGKCFYSNLNIECSRRCKRKRTQTASLDRVDSLKGYTLDNIKWVHKDINFMKGCLPHDKFIDWCHMISLNFLHEYQYPF